MRRAEDGRERSFNYHFHAMSGAFGERCGGVSPFALSAAMRLEAM
jgi:hypothetical protein